MPRYLVLVEINAKSPLDAERIIGTALMSVKGEPYIHQSNVLVKEE